MTRKIALIPVFNEESTLVPVAESVAPMVDLVLLVDDGSTDASLERAVSLSRRRENVEVLRLSKNCGMSAALREGFLHLLLRMRSGELDPGDILLTLDADGQHDSAEIEALCRHLDARGLDVALTRRDFSLYPGYKRIGNLLMTLWGRIWSGYRYSDIESGFRALRLRVLPPLLDYFTGYRYSCAQEIAVLTARLGFRVDNSFVTVIRRYRSQTGSRDVFINAWLGFRAYTRWLLDRKVPPRPSMARIAAPPEPC
ncbi:MAG: glycosyltransferase family 2 protein [Acidobacteria bacterium]|nr:glycosyltransferase family 2 protein [Acidobacteriota bacterium]